MGTNYYMMTEPCPHCCRGGGKVHIGKDSAGWSFVFSEQPDLNIHSVGDWFGQLIATDATIVNECNEEIPVDDFVDGVTHVGQFEMCVFTVEIHIAQRSGNIG